MGPDSFKSSFLENYHHSICLMVPRTPLESCFCLTLKLPGWSKQQGDQMFKGKSSRMKCTLGFENLWHNLESIKQHAGRCRCTCRRLCTRAPRIQEALNSHPWLNLRLWVVRKWRLTQGCPLFGRMKKVPQYTHSPFSNTGRITFGFLGV